MAKAGKLITAYSAVILQVFAEISLVYFTNNKNGINIPTATVAFNGIKRG